MSQSVTIAVGLGIGFLIVLPAIVAFRHDIANNFRRLWKSVKTGSVEEPPLEGSGNEVDNQSGDKAEGLSPTMKVFSICIGMFTTLYGILSGNLIFIASGIFVMLSTVLALIATKVVKN